jgi:phosphatidylserine/phosphatidylglycerophosphate/cardiolipin synthase-like enzyme
MPFDIASLRAFAPAQYQCEKCRALLIDDFSSLGLVLEIAMEKQSPTCPICRVAYLPTDEHTAFDWRRYINRNGRHCLTPEEALVQAQQLAEIVERMHFFQQYNNKKWTIYGYTPLRGLLKALSMARKFVHFTTYGSIPHLLIGALKVTAQRVHVRGIVSGVKGEMLSENTVSELTNYRDEAPDMDVKIYDPASTGWKSMPHQKLIVIDGLLAFKGSANLTLSGWRKAAEDRDTVDVVTEVEQVIVLHNRLFAPVWAEFSTIGEAIRMTRL